MENEITFEHLKIDNQLFKFFQSWTKNIIPIQEEKLEYDIKALEKFGFKDIKLNDDDTFDASIDRRRYFNILLKSIGDWLQSEDSITTPINMSYLRSENLIDS